MSKPTLLKTGTVIKNKHFSEADKKKIDTVTALDFLLYYIDNKINSSSKNAKTISIRAKSPGDCVVLLKSGTSSGKSTNVAPALFMKFEKSIIITQPKILTTIEITHDILKLNPDYFQLGKNLGYQTGALTKRSTQQPGLMYVTIGILLQQFIHLGIDWVSSRYAFIIIDEIHERDIDTDLTLFYIKKMLDKYWKSSNCPMIILMSATFNQELFISYFDIPPENYIEVLGQSFPIKDMWAQHDINDIFDRITNIVKQIHIENPEDCKSIVRDILIFVKGQSDIKQILSNIKGLNDLPEFKDNYVYPLALNRTIFIKADKSYQDIMLSGDDILVSLANIKNNVDINDKRMHRQIIKPTRRVIISTNIAETGVTIETLKYCIDTGYMNNIWKNAATGSEVKTNSVITQFMARQRRGRVGRKAPGIWYPLYTKETFDMMPEDQPPKLVTNDFTITLLGLILTETNAEFDVEQNTNIYEPHVDLFEVYVRDSDRMTYNNSSDIYKYMKIKTNVNNTYYRLKTSKEFNLNSLDLIALPSMDSILYSMEKLYVLGFIKENNQPTALGYFAFRFRKMSCENIKMVMSGYANQANILDLLTIAACLEIGWLSISITPRFKYKPFSPLGNKVDSLLASRVFWGCEFINYLWIWNAFTSYMDALIKKKKKNIMLCLEEWCIKNNLNIIGLMEVVALRDEYISMLITMDINPFYNGLGLSRGTYNLSDIIKKDIKLGLLEIQKIKKCILDGYRLNIAVWDVKQSIYVSQFKHNPLIIDTILLRPLKIQTEQEMVRPRIIIYSDIILQQKKTGDIYLYQITDAISIMDGFVTFDENLCIQY
jgi:HrpA-like RNA helicase